MIQIILLVCLILLNAFFAATEMAFVSLNDTKISVKAKEGDKKYKKIEKMLKSPSKFLATIQIGITLAGFLSSAFASDVFASQLAVVLFNLTHIFSTVVWQNISIVNDLYLSSEGEVTRKKAEEFFIKRDLSQELHKELLQEFDLKKIEFQKC